MPRPRHGVATVVIDGEAVIYDANGSVVHRLDPVGALVWQFLDGRSPTADVVADLAGAFGVPEHRVRADLAALMEQLGRNGLLAEDLPAADSPSDGRSA